MATQPEDELVILWPDLDVLDRDDYHSPHRRYLELEESLELKLVLLEKQIEQLEAAKELISTADLDSHTGSAALAEAEGDEDFAVHLIMNELDASFQRAKDCVSRGHREAGLDGSNFVSRLFGEEVDETGWNKIRDFLTTGAHNSSRGHGYMSIEDFYLDDSDCWNQLEMWDFLDDETTALQSSIMLSGTWRDPSSLAARLPVNPPYEADEDDIRLGRFLGATYGFLCLREQGIVVDTEETTSNNLESVLGFAPWVLPAASAGNSDELTRLLDVLDSLGMDASGLDDDPFSLTADADWVEEIRNTAASISSHLTKSLNGVAHLVHKDVQILLADGEDSVVAWVGNKRTGVITSFDRENFVVSAMPSPAAAFAAGCAISFYVDLTIDIRRMANIDKRVASGGRARRTEYIPTSGFHRQIREVANGTHRPPTAHFVAPHIRHLGNGRPNRAHVANAPERLRLRMGPHDTWVSGHVRGSGNVAEVMNRRRHYSMLADMIGLLR